MTRLVDLGVAPHEFDCDLSRRVRDDISTNSMSGWSVQRVVFHLLLTFNFNVTNPSRMAFETGPTATNLSSKRKARTSSYWDQLNEAPGIIPTKRCTVGHQPIKDSIRFKPGIKVHSLRYP